MQIGECVEPLPDWDEACPEVPDFEADQRMNCKETNCKKAVAGWQLAPGTAQKWERPAHLGQLALNKRSRERSLEASVAKTWANILYIRLDFLSAIRAIADVLERIFEEKLTSYVWN